MAHTLKSKAEAFCRSYSDSLGLTSRDKENTSEKTAEALFSHYLQQGFTAFTFGQHATFGDKDASTASIKRYLDKWNDLGLGLDFSMDDFRVEVVSDLGPQGGGLALCWITWSVQPPPESAWSGKGWNWENVYAFRVPPGQENGYFEFVVSDNEMSGLLQRIPNFMDGLW